MKLRWHLIAIVVASLLPLLLFAGVMISVSYQQRADLQRGMVDTARALSLAVDRELEASIRTLEAIATSEHLTSGDLEKFYRSAQDAIKGVAGWQSIALIDPSGRQILNLRSPFGTKLPEAAVPNTIKEVIEIGEPVVSDLFFGTIAKVPLVLIGVPVIRGGEVRYVLASSTSPGFLVTLLSQQRIPPDWIGAIVDNNKTIVAGTRDLQRFIGQPATARFTEESTWAEEGWFRNVTRDGWPVYTAFSRSQLSGWTVALAIPAAAVEAPIRSTLLFTGIGGLLLLAGGIALAGILGYRIARAAVQLSAGARALGRDQGAALKPLPIAELDQVRREMEIATAQLKGTQEELRASREQLRALAGYLQSVREEERTRIARELHDEIGQVLTGIKFALEMSLRKQDDNVKGDLAQALELTHELIARVRDLSLELRPAMLDDLGLLAALTWHIDRYTTQFKIKVDFKHRGLQGRRFAPETETAAYRIVQEALTNVARHSGIDNVEVGIYADKTALQIRIKDHGVGFDPDALPARSTGGLSGMRERAIILNGRLEIQSRPKTGTLLTAELPIQANNRQTGGD